jgi:hypothetical protein
MRIMNGHYYYITVMWFIICDDFLNGPVHNIGLDRCRASMKKSQFLAEPKKTFGSIRLILNKNNNAKS